VNKIKFQSLPPDVREIIQTISMCADTRGVSAWLVGGMVRDLLLGRTSLDVDVVVEEDVWLATNVTLLSGVTVGRGAVVGSGAVCRTSIPPYAIVVGNPAKIVGFRFSPEEVIKHEGLIYSEHERYHLEVLEKNYTRYFINNIKEINNFLRL